jgi:hypothetical protein
MIKYGVNRDGSQPDGQEVMDLSVWSEVVSDCDGIHRIGDAYVCSLIFD